MTYPLTDTVLVHGHYEHGDDHHGEEAQESTEDGETDGTTTGSGEVLGSGWEDAEEAGGVQEEI